MILNFTVTDFYYDMPGKRKLPKKNTNSSTKSSKQSPAEHTTTLANYANFCRCSFERQVQSPILKFDIESYLTSSLCLEVNFIISVRIHTSPIITASSGAQDIVFRASW